MTVFILAMSLLLVISCRANSSDLDEAIFNACSQYGVEPQLVYLIIEAESNFDQFAKSRCDARGLMQITPRTWGWVCREMLGVDWDFAASSFCAERNIEVGVRYLKWINDYLDRHSDELKAPRRELILACYNAGSGNVKRAGFTVPCFDETQRYISKILNQYRRLADLPAHGFTANLAESSAL